MLHLALAFVIALGSFDDAAASPCATDIGPHAVALLAGGSHTGFSVVAKFLNPAIHYDCVGCAAIAAAGIGGANPRDPDAFRGSGGRGKGVNPGSRRCENPCQAPLPCAPNPDRPALDAARQHTPTRAIAVAFFDATLRQDTAADCFLRHRLEDDAPEVTSAPAADSERRRRLLAGKGGT